MLNYLFSAITGIIQGITEFLPISSTGHLIITDKFFNLPIENKLAFDVSLHLATLMALLIYFFNDIINLIKFWILSFFGKAGELGKLSWQILVATIPAALIAYFFESYIENVLSSVLVIAVMLIIIGLFLLYIEKISRQEKEINSLNYFQTTFIGLSQAVALIPGTSRSGITIIAGLITGLKREAAAKFSFLLSIPIVAGAAIKKVPDLFGTHYVNGEIEIIIIAFIFSLISGIITIKYFLNFLKNGNLRFFAIYRIVFAVIILILYFVKILN